MVDVETEESKELTVDSIWRSINDDFLGRDFAFSEVDPYSAFPKSTTLTLRTWHPDYVIMYEYKTEGYSLIQKSDNIEEVQKFYKRLSDSVMTPTKIDDLVDSWIPSKGYFILARDMNWKAESSSQVFGSSCCKQTLVTKDKSIIFENMTIVPATADSVIYDYVQPTLIYFTSSFSEARLSVVKYVEQNGAHEKYIVVNEDEKVAMPLENSNYESWTAHIDLHGFSKLEDPDFPAEEVGNLLLQNKRISLLRKPF